MTVNGNATFYIPDITYGNKTVVVSYAGSVNYLSNSTTKVFAVFKRVSGINVTAVGGSVGSDAHINVTVTPGATGNVVINVNGTNYTVTLDANGKAVLDIAGLGNGSYPVSVTYLGDGKFNSSTNVTDPFVMSKILTTVDLNFSDINAGDDARFEVTMNPNIDGTVGYNGCIYCSKIGSGEYAGNINEDLITQFNNVKEAADSIGISKTGIYNCCCSKQN